MIVDADDAAALAGQLRADTIELCACPLDGLVRPPRAHDGVPQFQDRQHAAIPEWTVVQVHVGRVIQIDWDLKGVQSRITLRRPRASRLPITGGVDAEDAPQRPEPGLLTTDELGYSLMPIQIPGVLRGRRMHAVVGRVVGNIVLGQGPNHVVPPTCFQHPGLLTDNLERSPHILLAEHLRQSLGRIVGLRQNEILRIKPEGDVHRSLFLCGQGRHRKNQRSKKHSD